MKKMNLGGTVSQPLPLDVSQLTEGMTVADRGTGEQAQIVAILRSKITFRTATGQYSMLPPDFVKKFGACPEPTYEECKHNLSRALNVPDDVAATILKTGKVPDGF